MKQIIFLISIVSCSITLANTAQSIELKDSIKKHKKLSFYDTSSVFKNFWIENVTFAYANSTFDKSDLLRITDSLHGYAFPIESETTSGFGRRHGGYHKGIDIPISTGTKIVAAFDGKVRYAKYNSGGFGNLVIIRHPNGLETYYAHMSKLKVKVNQVVKAGQLIGLSGNTGRSYSPHLHFEVRYYDVAIDPEKLFDLEKYCLRKDIAIVDDLMRPNGAPKKTLPSNIGNRDTYAVRSGDTLSKIANRYGTSVEELCQLNGIDRNSILQIGQRIVVN